MKRDIHCRHEGEDNKAPYHYMECGLDDVYLLSGYEKEDTEYGEVVTVCHADELHEVIGLHLVQNKKVLNGKELRFLRKEMDLTQAQLGRLLGLTNQAVARWEKDQTDVTGPADYLIRVLFLDSKGKLTESHPLRDLFATLNEQDAGREEDRQVFEQVDSDWKPTALAA